MKSPLSSYASCALTLAWPWRRVLRNVLLEYGWLSSISITLWDLTVNESLCTPLARKRPSSLNKLCLNAVTASKKNILCCTDAADIDTTYLPGTNAEKEIDTQTESSTTWAILCCKDITTKLFTELEISKFLISLTVSKFSPVGYERDIETILTGLNPYLLFNLNAHI